MKYVCLGYHAENVWEGRSLAEQQAFMDRCFAYDDELKEAGHFVGGEGLQGSENAVTLRPSVGKTVLTDGPYAESKEQIGGLLMLEANDLNHAIQLMSKHPSCEMGTTWEIRPTFDLEPFVAESRQRRNVTA